MKEIDENISDYKKINFDEIKKLNLLDSLMKEALRLLTPIPNTFLRVAKKDHVLGGDLFIKKNTAIIPTIIASMSNPKYFKNPE